MNTKEKSRKNNKRQFNIPFLLFCLGNFTFFFRSLFFLITCWQENEKQIIFDNGFKIVDISSHILIFAFLLSSCLLDYKKINKNFIFFDKKCLSMYIGSGLIYLFSFCLDIFFTKILYHLFMKNNFFSDASNYKIYATINFVIVNFLSFLSNMLQWTAKKNIFNKKI